MVIGNQAAAPTVAQRGVIMRIKAIAAAVIVVAGIVLAVGLRTVNRADAAGGNCYSAAQGPSTPTICG